MDDYEIHLLASVNDSVAAGARWLDRSCPGWEARLFTRVDVGRWDACVLGQLSAEYASAAAALSNSSAWLIDHGFLRHPATLLSYTDLSAAWEALIYTRGTRSVINLEPPAEMTMLAA